MTVLFNSVTEVQALVMEEKKEISELGAPRASARAWTEGGLWLSTEGNYSSEVGPLRTSSTADSLQHCASLSLHRLRKSVRSK